jgi:hypothetical protein
VQGFGAKETLHFRTTTFWAQLLLGVGCNCLGLFATLQAMELSEQPLAVKNVVQFGLYVA